MTRFSNVQRREPICDQAEALRLHGSFTNSRFGFHAGQQIKPTRPATSAEVDAIFSRVANGVRRLRDEEAA